VAVSESLLSAVSDRATHPWEGLAETGDLRSAVSVVQISFLRRTEGYRKRRTFAAKMKFEGQTSVRNHKQQETLPKGSSHAPPLKKLPLVLRRRPVADASRLDSERRRSAAMGPALHAQHGLGRNRIARRIRSGNGPERQMVGRLGNGLLRIADRVRGPSADRHQQQPAARPETRRRPRRLDVFGRSRRQLGLANGRAEIGLGRLSGLAAGRYVLAAHRRGRSGLHGDQPGRGRLPGPARHAQRQRRAVPGRRPSHDARRGSRRSNPVRPTRTSCGGSICGPRPGSGLTTRRIARSCWTARTCT
jgi:hypothetical protein